MSDVANGGRDELLTAQEVAKTLKVSVRTVWDLEKRGLMRAVRITTKIVRFKRSQIDAMMAVA
jgi:excisionase family DNA binding protein